jgi:hypothetical protein
MNQQQQHQHIQDDHNNPNLGAASYAFYQTDQDPSYALAYPPQMSPYQVVPLIQYFIPMPHSINFNRPHFCNGHATAAGIVS